MGSVIDIHPPGTSVADLYDIAVSDVAPAFPRAATAHWTMVESAGGFSGARVWRGEAAGRTYCLKAHPRGADSGRLRTVHLWMSQARTAGLDFVPAIERTREGHTVVEIADRPWEVMEWMPGRADFRDKPTDARLFAAASALARLHAAWTVSLPAIPCPAIKRRHQALLEWGQLVERGWHPRISPRDPVRPSAEAAWNLLPRAVASVTGMLGLWLTRPVPVQRCVCDVWHDHVLFDGDQVTGIIDFAAARVDHVAIDVARLLGSLVPDDAARTAAAIRAYEVVRPLPQPELVPLLDRAGVVVGAINWLRWLYHDGREYLDRDAVADRLAALAARLPQAASG